MNLNQYLVTCDWKLGCFQLCVTSRMEAVHELRQSISLKPQKKLICRKPPLLPVVWMAQKKKTAAAGGGKSDSVFFLLSEGETLDEDNI